MPLASIAAFLDALQEYQLLKPARLDTLRQEWMPHLHEPIQALVDHLIERGWLTLYMVDELLAGRGRGLRLGQYVFLERLGVGGMGQVFKAQHWTLERTEAVKTIRPDRLDHPATVERFQREARAAAQLRHRNIVLIYDADAVAGIHFLAMEFIEGIDLARLVKEQGKRPVYEACEYICQAAEGLQFAYEADLVHRDIKPHNLLLAAKDSQVKILDFGLARFASETGSITEPNSAMGTPDYMAPEQINNASQADIRADIYSLGCTFCHLLCGSPPFSDLPWGMKLVAHQTHNPDPLDCLPANLPDGLPAVLRRMIARLPEDRYQTPAEVVAALAPFLQSQIDTPPPPPLPDPPLPLPDLERSLWERMREKLPWGVMALAALVVGVVLAVWLPWPWPPKPEPPPGEPDWGPHFPNSLGMTLVRLPPGSFRMGSPSTEEGRPQLPVEDDEAAHDVQLTKPVWLGAHEVTQKQFWKVMGFNPSESVAVQDRNREPKETADYPVENVRWDDADIFCQKLSKQAEERQHGRRYCLPTEAEWEYACRAGTTTPFACTGPDQLGEFAWYKVNADGKGPQPVGRKKPNDWKLFDMHGNVWEWCQDYYAVKNFREPLTLDPLNQEGTRGDLLVMRGGAFDLPARYCRSAARMKGFVDARIPNLGFRVACVPISRER